jgi:hypothetical protein
MRQAYPKPEVGQRFSRWTVLSEPVAVEDQGRGKRYVLCVCDCGTERVVRIWYLFQGRSLSCGCLRIERQREAMTVHGDSHTPLYNSWHAMMNRCYSSTDTQYWRYGGRGIRVCSSWHAYLSFKSWAVTHGWQLGLQIDRINGFRGYYPANCRWATPQQNTNNRTNTRIVSAFGETKPLTEWVKDARCLVAAKTLRTRLERGWTDEESMRIPLHGRR